MIELVNVFVDELPTRAAAFEAALGAEDLTRLRTLAHQLRGSAAGYGFAPLGDVAGAIERMIVDGAAGVESLRQRVEELVGMCERARSGRG